MCFLLLLLLLEPAHMRHAQMITPFPQCVFIVHGAYYKPLQIKHIVCPVNSSIDSQSPNRDAL